MKTDYLITKPRPHWSFDPFAARAARNAEARKARTARAIKLALGTALFIAATGTTPLVKQPRTIKKATVVDISDLLS